MFGFWKKKKPSTVPIHREPAYPHRAKPRSASNAAARAEAGQPSPTEAVATATTTQAPRGLRDQDLDALYRVAKINVLEPGTQFLGLEDNSPSLHRLVKGLVALRDGAGNTVMQAETGAWIGHLDDTPDGTPCFSAVTIGPASVLTLDSATYQRLDPELQLRVLTEIQTHQYALLRAMTTRNEDLGARQQVLVDALYHSRHASDAGLSKSETVRQIIQKVPRIPVSTATLLSKLFDEHSTHAEVVELVKSDPSLTATLLKAINSPLYGLNHKINNINHAVTLLGFDGVHQLVLSESMRKSLPETSRFQENHLRAVETSQLAFAAAQATGARHPAEISTIALLHGIGTVVLELLKTANPHLELVLTTVDSAGMGAELLRAWNLPEPLCRSIELQHLPEFALPERVPEDVRANVALLFLANRFHDHIHGETEGTPWPFASEYLGVLGASGHNEMDFFYQKVRPTLMARLKTLPKSLAETLSN